MITIDRSAATTVQDQLVEQLRYLIVSGHYKVEEKVPSTRALGDQLGISFHTVRKAYQQLEQEGLLAARVGHGFIVKERVPLGKTERMERGAAFVLETLQRLIGLGLEEDEIEYLFQEQLDLLEGAHTGHKLVCAAAYREMAEACAAQITRVLQQPVEAVTLAQLSAHQDAEYIVAPCPDLRHVMAQVPRADAVAIVTYLDPAALERVARLFDHQTLAVVTRYPDAIQPLMTAVRQHTGFTGQMIAATVEDQTRHLPRFARQADLIVYTPASRRRLLSVLDEAPPHLPIAPVVSRDSLAALQRIVPS